MLLNSKIHNLIHNSGYKISMMRSQDIDDRIRAKIPDPTWSDATYLFKNFVTFIEPISNKKFILKKINTEDVYLDILRFQAKYNHIQRFDIPNGESGNELLNLINKYGYINWAEEIISFNTYNHLEKYIKKINNGYEADSLFDYEARSFLKNFINAKELIDEWINVIYYITDNESDWDYSKYMGMSGFNEKYLKIQPYSLGASLLFFHKLSMPKYSVAECRICDDLFIQKRNTGKYCSNKCRVKNYKNNKLLAN